MRKLDPDKKFKLYIALWVVFVTLFSVFSILYGLKLSKDIQKFVVNYPIKEVVQTEVEKATSKLSKPQVGVNGFNGQEGRNGFNGLNGIGIAGANGKDAQSCTTYTDDLGDSYVACPDGTKTLIAKPNEPRQFEACTSPTVPFGWRLVGSVTCLAPGVGE